MPGLVPGIHVFNDVGRQDVGGRDIGVRKHAVLRTAKPGHDGYEAFRYRQTDATNPHAIRITAGQKVKKASRPGPIGLGLGSLVSPSSAAATISSSGPVPRTSSARPI
jgi:hypothetical protein